MKDIFVNALEANQHITTTFLVKSKQLRTQKTGRPYLALVVSDKSGELEAKMWDGVEEVDPTFDRDDFIKIKGVIQIYRDKPQLTIHRLRRCQEEEIDLADYLPKTTKNVESMFEELLSFIQDIENPFLKKLLMTFMHDEIFVLKFKRAPAAKSLHHAWLGGLLEHTLSLCHLCRLVAPRYPNLDVDLLLTAAVLHDIGKTEELSYTRSFSYTNEGQLLGHIVLELELINERISRVEGFPHQLKVLLQHLIISHHGEHAFGSPKLPMFPEALILHSLDNLDSKLEAMSEVIASDSGLSDDWTGHSHMFQRPLFKGYAKDGKKKSEKP